MSTQSSSPQVYFLPLCSSTWSPVEVLRHGVSVIIVTLSLVHQAASIVLVSIKARSHFCMSVSEASTSTRSTVLGPSSYTLCITYHQVLWVVRLVCSLYYHFHNQITYYNYQYTVYEISHAIMSCDPGGICGQDTLHLLSQSCHSYRMRTET